MEQIDTPIAARPKTMLEIRTTYPIQAGYTVTKVGPFALVFKNNAVWIKIRIKPE